MAGTDSPLLLQAKPVTEAIYNLTSKQVSDFRARYNRAPTLATILVGEDPASQIYVRRKGEMSIKLGLGHKDFKLPATTSQAELVRIIDDLNADPSIDGILCQKPLPKPLNESEVFDRISPAKDVDCFAPHNVGLLSQGRPILKPCTPAGVMEILKFYKIDVRGKNALVVGRSDIVGKPMGMLLLHQDATVTYAHSKTRDLSRLVSEADIVVAAIGRPKMLGGDLPWKSSAIVIDVGINRLPSGKMAGDVDFETVAPKVHAITPVPGGVGPMTIAMLMVNTVTAAFAREGANL